MNHCHCRGRIFSQQPCRPNHKIWNMSESVHMCPWFCLCVRYKGKYGWNCVCVAPLTAAVWISCSLSQVRGISLFSTTPLWIWVSPHLFPWTKPTPLVLIPLTPLLLFRDNPPAHHSSEYFDAPHLTCVSLSAHPTDFISPCLSLLSEFLK